MWLTFFTALLFWLCLKIINSKSIYLTLLLGLTSGILFATKVSHLIILPLPIFALFIKHFRSNKKSQILSFKKRIKYKISDVLIGNFRLDLSKYLKFFRDIVALCA